MNRNQNHSIDKGLTLQHISKMFAEVKVLDDVTLNVVPGEFFTLLGPSGCGKTTLLRIIAGLELADSGQISLGGKDITRLPAIKRQVNTVFQSYALFPHLTILRKCRLRPAGAQVPRGGDKKTGGAEAGDVGFKPHGRAPPPSAVRRPETARGSGAGPGE